MPISFNQMPSNQRVPIVAAEFDNSRASQGPALLAFKALLIGQKTSAGSAVADSIVKCSSEVQAIQLAGRGSLLHRMYAAWQKVNKGQTDVYLGVLADNGAGVLATKTLTVTGPATAAGTIQLYVGGVLVQTAVANGDAQNAIATAIAAAITANLDLPITASATTNVVTTTARNKGVAGQDLDLRLNYQDGDVTPAGVSIVIANAVAGITNPVMTALITNLGDTWYQVIAHPYYDATSFTALETELSSRFGPTRMIDGLAITSAPGTQSTLGTLGATRNSPHNIIVAAPSEKVVSQPAELAAAVAGAVAISASADPGRPFQTLPLPGIKGGAEVDLFQNSERNLMLYSGVGTTKVGGGGLVQIERLMTTYETNAAGAADTSYAFAEVMFTLMYLRYSFRNRWASKYSRHKLGSDGARIGAGQALMTPKLAKAEALTWFRELEEIGLVEGFDQFKTDLVVERDLSDPNRLNFLLPPDVINQLVVTAAKIQFLL